MLQELIILPLFFFLGIQFAGSILFQQLFYAARETLGWLKLAEQSFEFWNDPADAVYDSL